MKLGSGANVDLWLEEVLQQEEIEVAGRLNRTWLFVRIGQTLGLAGTIIPLSAALECAVEGGIWPAYRRTSGGRHQCTPHQKDTNL